MTATVAYRVVWALTVGRLVCGAIILPLAGLLDWWEFCAVAFLAAGVTDMVDGALARRWRVSSEAGGRLDSNADAVLTLGGMLAVTVGGVWRWWLLIAILALHQCAIWLERSKLEGDALGLLVLAVPVANFLLITFVAAGLLNLAFGVSLAAVLIWASFVWAILAFIKRNRVGAYLRYVIAKSEDRNAPY